MFFMSPCHTPALWHIAFEATPLPAASARDGSARNKLTAITICKSSFFTSFSPFSQRTEAFGQHRLDLCERIPHFSWIIQSHPRGKDGANNEAKFHAISPVRFVVRQCLLLQLR
jgi:hypothetical protein